MQKFIHLTLILSVLTLLSSKAYASDIFFRGDILKKDAIKFEDTKPQDDYIKIKASHILVDTKIEADAIQKRLNEGETFESLAKKYSKCPSSAQGGDLGYFSKGTMVKPFEDVAFSLPVGTVSEPVKTQFGWHLIKIYDRK